MKRDRSNEPINQRWVLTGIAGRGASAVVYRAFDLVTEEVVAFKVLIPASGRLDRVAARARREFLDLAGLRHPNLVETYDLGVVEQGSLARGSAFFTMELLARAELRGPACAPRRIARIALDLLAGLECVHAHGLVHRDIKPSNVLLGMDGGGAAGRVKLSDLGLAGSASGRRATRFSGTLQYAAPEAIAGAPADPRSDLFSLGVVLFEAATGALPFDHADPAAAIAWRLAARDEPDPRGRRLTGVLASVVGRLLSRRPESRYALARSAWEDIAEIVLDGNEPDSDGRERPSSDGPLVGRSRERGALVRWLRQSARRGGHLRIVGVEGAGRSRLAREAALIGRTQALSVHETSCADGMAPLLPFQRPLREILLERIAGLPASRERGALAGLRHEEILTLLGGPAVWGAPARGFTEAGRTIASALARFLAANVRGRSLLLVLDDLDRADALTRAVVDEIDATRVEGACPLLVVSTSRAELAGPGVRSGRDTGRGPGTGGACARTARERGARLAEMQAIARRASKDVMAIGPLEREDGRTLLARLPGVGELGPVEIETVLEAAAGWPGRIVRLARAIGGRQRPLFPPLREPSA